MNSFYDFILKDIDGKKEQIGALPLRTKANKKKYNQILEDMITKYDAYKDNVKKYLVVKAKNMIKYDKDDDHMELVKKIEELKYGQNLLNPYNTYVEKLGFDSLLYQMDCPYTLNFKALNKIINEFLDKFEDAGITLDSDKFNYTVYVKQYMESFLEIRNKDEKDYSKISKVFEDVYWLNPDLIKHINLNFRKLLRDYSSQFKTYLNKLTKAVKDELDVDDYDNCVTKLADVCLEYNVVNREDINDVIKLSVDGVIDIEHYVIDNKVRKNAFDSILGDDFNLENKDKVNRVCDDLSKLKVNLLEYSNFVKFSPLFDSFKEEFSDLLNSTDSKKKNTKLAEIEAKIIKTESELDKLNKKITSGKKSLFGSLSTVDIKNLKIDSVLKANNLYEMYEEYEKEYFRSKIENVIFSNMSAKDLIMLYSSFDYFKKTNIQKVYEVESYEDLVQLAIEFDNFARSPLNNIMEGVLIFGDFDIPKVISMKYKLSDIKLDEDALGEDNINALINKINVIIRSIIIDNGNVPIEKIRFVTKVNKYNKK